MTESNDNWNAKQYLLFQEYRDRPFYDLIEKIPLKSADVSSIVDFGCGTGHQTCHLASKFSNAQVIGVDSSIDMISKAKGLTNLSFVHKDIKEWEPVSSRSVDLILSNSALHWCAKDLSWLFPKWHHFLKKGGVMALQIPNNFDQPSHVILNQLRNANEWKEKLQHVAADKDLGVKPVEEYTRKLYDMGFESVDAWQTTYLHVLKGDNPVLNWLKGTTVTPLKSVLNENELGKFCSDYSSRLNKAYPAKPYGTIFPFTRMFIIARK